MLALRVLDDLMDNGWDKGQHGNFVPKRGRHEISPIMEWRILGYCFEGQLDIPFRHDNEGVLGEAGAEAVRMQTISMIQGKGCKRYWNSFRVCWCGRLWNDSEKWKAAEKSQTV